jgi:hypothetical protein
MLDKKFDRIPLSADRTGFTSPNDIMQHRLCSRLLGTHIRFVLLVAMKDRWNKSPIQKEQDCVIFFSSPGSKKEKE